MSFLMPSTFPHDRFREFGRGAGKFFPAMLSSESYDDPLQKRLHFDRACFAVCYRYRACSEYNEAFKALLANAGESWREGYDQDHNYKIEQCLFQFYMNALSVFDTFGFCLYFVGRMVNCKHFSLVSKPDKITLNATSKEFGIAFPSLSITKCLAELLNDTEFRNIQKERNILTHRLAAMRCIRVYNKPESDGTQTNMRDEILNVPGLGEEPKFDGNLIQHPFNEITRLLTTLLAASIEFVPECK